MSSDEKHDLCQDTYLDALAVIIASIGIVLVLVCLVHFLINYYRNRRHASHLQIEIPRRFLVLFLLLSVLALVSIIFYTAAKLACTGDDPNFGGPVTGYRIVAAVFYLLCADCLQMAIIFRLLMIFGPQTELFPISLCLKRTVYGIFVASNVLNFVGLAVSPAFSALGRPLIILGMLLYLGNWFLLCTLFVVRSRKSERLQRNKSADANASAHPSENENEKDGQTQAQAPTQTQKEWKLIKKHTVLTVVSFASTVATLLIFFISGVVSTDQAYLLAVVLDITICIDSTTNVICVYFQFAVVDRYYRYLCDRKSLLETEEQELMPTQTVDDNGKGDGDGDGINIEVGPTTATTATAGDTGAGTQDQANNYNQEPETE